MRDKRRRRDLRRKLFAHPPEFTGSVHGTYKVLWEEIVQMHSLILEGSGSAYAGYDVFGYELCNNLVHDFFSNCGEFRLFELNKS